MIRYGFPRDWFLIPLAAVVGTMAGVVAFLFERMVEFSSHELFGRFYKGSVLFEGDQYIYVFIIPVIGGLIVGQLTKLAAGKSGGHGVPDIIESLARKQGILPKRSGIYKALTASITIGTGGSAGVEGPIIQIGGVLGSATGQFIKLGREHMHTLVGCGAAGGMAAIFNAPIAGVLFVLEVLLRDFSPKTFIPIVVASVFGTAVAHALIAAGDGESAMISTEATFHVSGMLREWSPRYIEFGVFIVLGILCALVGVAFTRSMIAFEANFSRLPISKPLRPAVGGAMLGVLGIVFMIIYRQPIGDQYSPPLFYGNGYGVIDWLFDTASYGQMLVDGEPSTAFTAGMTLLAVMLVFKIAGTCFTIGSGGSGGILAPSLFLGATVGGMFGLALQWTGWFTDINPAAYALVGMAGVFAAAVHCPLTAFLLVFEVTNDYKAILPVMLVAILSTTVSQMMCRDTVYTHWLAKLGMRMGIYSDTSLLRRLYVSQVRLVDAALVHPDEPAQRLLELAEEYAVTDYVVIDEKDEYVGMVVGEDVRTTLLQREAVPLLIVSELMRDGLPTVTRDMNFVNVLDIFAKHDISSLPVVDDHRHVIGMVTRGRVMRHYQHALETDD